MQKDRTSKFLDLVSPEQPGVHEKAAWRKANKGWLKKSAMIAVKILDALLEKNMSQKDLATALGVSPQYISKVVKGQENLSLEVIDKLENALGVELVKVKSTVSYGSATRQNFMVQAIPQRMLFNIELQLKMHQPIGFHQVHSFNFPFVAIEEKFEVIYESPLLKTGKQHKSTYTAGENNYAMSA